MTETQTSAVPLVPTPPQRSLTAVASDGVTFLVYWMVILLLLGQAVTSVLRPPEGELAAGLACALVCLLWGTFCLVMGVLRVEGPEGAQSPPPGWLVVVTSAGCLVSLVFLRTSMGMVGVWSAETMAAGLLVASLTVWRGPLVGGISGVVLAAAMMIAPLSQSQGDPLVTTPLAESIPAIAVLAAGFCAALALGALGRTAQTLQRSLDERDEALVREHGVRAAAQVAAEVERSLHDTALNTLETIASHGDHLDPAAIVARCRSDVDRLASWRSEAVIHSLSEVLAGLEAHSRRLGLVIEATLVSGRPGYSARTGAKVAPDVPQPVLAAMARAGAEALTNVAKHARVTRATVLVTQDGGGLQVFVADDGVGSGATSDGFGVSRSIRERMGAVGGQARIGPGANDRGTVVLLEWHPPSASNPQPGSDLLLRMAGVVLMMATFLAGGAGALVVLGWTAYAHPWLALAAALAPVLVGVGGCLGDARAGRRLGAMHVIAACATYVAVSAAALLVDPYCSSLLGEGVMIDARAPMMAILLLLAPRPGVLAAVVGTVGIAHAMASLAWNDRWLLCGPSTASAGVYVIAALVASWLFVRRIDRVSAELAGAREEAVAAQVRMSRELAVRAEEELWVADTLAWVQDLLEDIAEGRADPTDVQVRAKCAAHAEFLRALLTVGRAPMTLRRPTRIWLRLLHSAGCSIRVRGSFEGCDPPGVTVGEVGALIDAVCQLAPGSLVTLAAWSDPDQTFMVTAEGGHAKLTEALIERVRETPGSAWHEVGPEGLTVEWAWEGAVAVPASDDRSR